MRPAARTKRTSSSIFCSVSVRAPAAWKISSRTTVPCTSFAPKWSATCAIGIPIMIQYAFTFGTLSSRRRDTAITFRSSAPVVCRQPRRWELRDAVDGVGEVAVRGLRADHVDLRVTAQLSLAQRVVHELVARVGVRARLLLRDRKGTELALHATNVRLVEIQVLDEE